MRKKIIYILLGASIMGSSCDALSDFGDMNDNPSATTKPITSALLTNVLAGIGDYAARTHYQPGLYAQYISETQYTEASTYTLAQLSFTGFYSGHLMDLQNIINTEVDNPNMRAVATVLQQYIFWYLTDCWGEIPYSEALQGVLPKYDSQEEIYKGLLAKLTEAENALGTGGLITGDLIYNGDTSAWKKFANSLRMLISLQISKRYTGPSDYAATEFKAALNDSDGYISSNDQNFTVKYPGGNFKNPWRNTYDGRKDYAQSKTLTDITASLADGRQAAFGGATEDLSAPNAFATSNIGFPYGLSRTNAEAFASANTGFARVLRGDFRREDSPYVVIGAGQVALARAEAAQLGWTTENKANVYRQGIELSFAQWGVVAPATYFTQSGVALNGTNEMAKISQQRYIAHYPDGRMGWNIWRKSGVPSLTPAPGATAGSTIPRRFMYASTEYSTNKENVEAAVARMGGTDLMSNRVWWDVQ
jgi:hypothetical protein